MPGSSVSACHMCHLHGHSQDSLVRTSPLRSSRGRSKSSKYSAQKHHHGHGHGHGHTNSGYSSSRDDGTRVHRSNSASALARLTDNSHSLPGSRSNSLSRYHREVSIMPDGGDTFGHMLSSSSTRSLDMNPPLTNILDVRTTSLPRISSILHSQPHIHAQPDILVNAMPRSSRANSRSGSISRNAVNMSQDNSHDYYLDIHRQRFKEEKRKHRFNLQTVMLIGCYTLLVMIAIVVGIVLCYQNGWFGLGPPQEKISGDILRFNNSNSLQRGASDSSSRRRTPDKTGDGRLVADGRITSRNRENTNHNVNNDNRQFSSNDANVIQGSLHPSVQTRNEEQFNNQRNVRNRHRPAVNVGQPLDSVPVNIPHFHVNSFPIQSPSVPLRHDTDVHTANENQRLSPTSTGTLPAHIINQPQHPIHQNRNFNQNVHSPSSFPAGVPLAPNRVPSIPAGTHLIQTDVLAPSGLPLIPGGLPTAIRSNINTKNKVTVHIPTDNLLNHHTMAQSSQNKPSIREGNVDSNIIAKTLLPAGVPLSQSVQSNFDRNNSKPKFTVIEKSQDQLKINRDSFSPHSIFSIPSDDKILSANSGSLTTQDLLDLLAIRRMRDLLNSEGNAKSILDILRNVEPSEDMRLEAIKKETVNPVDEGTILEENGSRRGKGRSIQLPGSDTLNSIQFRQLLESMIKDAEEKNQESSNISIQVEKHKPVKTETTLPPSSLNIDSISSNINNLINNTINGAIIRLLNKKNSENEHESEVDVNISGVSVFPLNSEDLKILLESNPSNVEKNIGPLDESKLKSFQILHKLIELNNLRQKVQKHIDNQDSSRKTSSTTPAERAKATPVTVSRIGIPLSGHNVPDLSGKKHSNVINHKIREHNFGVPLRNVTASFNRGSTLSIEETHPFNPEPIPEPDPSASATPDPTFAVMVRTDGLNNPTQSRRAVSPNAQRGKISIQSETQSQVPIKEEASIHPGRSRDSELKAVIRAWTHMDSEGTLSKGRIHSDGSFTFTNCRPVEVCKDKKGAQNNRSQSDQNDAKHVVQGAHPQ